MTLLKILDIDVVKQNIQFFCRVAVLDLKTPHNVYIFIKFCNTKTRI